MSSNMISLLGCPRLRGRSLSLFLERLRLRLRSLLVLLLACDRCPVELLLWRLVGLLSLESCEEHQLQLKRFVTISRLKLYQVVDFAYVEIVISTHRRKNSADISVVSVHLSLCEKTCWRA